MSRVSILDLRWNFGPFAKANAEGKLLCLVTIHLQNLMIQNARLSDRIRVDVVRYQRRLLRQQPRRWHRMPLPVVMMILRDLGSNQPHQWWLQHRLLNWPLRIKRLLLA